MSRRRGTESLFVLLFFFCPSEQDRRFRDGITKQLAKFIEENFAKEQKTFSKL